jgi:hypothetical protein
VRINQLIDLDCLNVRKLHCCLVVTCPQRDDDLAVRVALGNVGKHSAAVEIALPAKDETRNLGHLFHACCVARLCSRSRPKPIENQYFISAQELSLSLVEPRGIEPLTSAVRLQRSPI